MNSGPIDISSDEESGRNEKEDEEIYDWISELMDSIDNQNDDDSDDVVVIGEVNIKPKVKSSKPTVTDVDDDCVVLDGDPDKPVSVVDDSGSNSDEVLVVGEKGQIACRDYPHPRHLCAKFPFKTTLHATHCDLCHCYVCDSLAPCVHWGTGVSNIDHCHATDKEETWKILRKNSKMVKSAQLPAPKLPAALPKLSQCPPLNIIRLAPSSISQNQLSRPTTIRACSSASRTMPSVRNPGRSHQSEFILSKNRAHPCSVSKQSVGARNNVVGRNRGHNIGNLGPQFVSSHPMFKRVGAVGGTLPVNRTTFGSANNSSCTSPSQYGRNSTPTAAPSDRNHFRWQNVPSTVHQNCPQPMATFVGNTVPSQPQTCSPMATIFDSVFSSNFPDQGNHRQNDGQYISQYGNQSQDANQGGYQYGNQSQNSSQNICLQDNLCASVADMGFSDCNYSWVDNSCQSIQHPPIQQPPFQPPPVETSQIQSTEPIYVPSLVKEQSNEIANVSLDSQLTWLLENQSVPAVTSDSVPSHLNVLSPEPTFIEPGMLMFDFETSWNGLTQV
ncbi:hypothetical protein CerSpe_291200 [Prunus speciosa]